MYKVLTVILGLPKIIQIPALRTTITAAILTAKLSLMLGVTRQILQPDGSSAMCPVATPATMVGGRLEDSTLE